jgi:hypothetical protein
MDKNHVERSGDEPSNFQCQVLFANEGDEPSDFWWISVGFANEGDDRRTINKFIFKLAHGFKIIIIINDSRRFCPNRPEFIFSTLYSGWL